MKPDWKDAPEWAKWLVMDGDGWWYWSEDEPGFDIEEQAWFGDDEDAQSTVASDEPDESGIDWDHAFDTKEPRP